MSADGSKMVAVGSGQPAIYTSTNSGATWVPNNTVTNFYGQSVASSADGTKLVLVGIVEPAIRLSTNSGATWASNGTPGLYWQSVASSADGTRLVAAEEDGAIYTSTNSGTTWTSNSVPFTFWRSVASSADGSKLVAVISGNFPNLAYGIYISDSTPTPQLNLAPSGSNLTASWIIPSKNFVVQQSPDLSSWTDVTNAPTLNLSNLQDEVVLSPTNTSGFYRLTTP